LPLNFYIAIRLSFCETKMTKDELKDKGKQIKEKIENAGSKTEEAEKLKKKFTD